VNIINTLTLRSLKLNRKRTIVTIIGIILSTAMICGTITLSASFQDLFLMYPGIVTCVLHSFDDLICVYHLRVVMDIHRVGEQIHIHFADALDLGDFLTYRSLAGRTGHSSDVKPLLGIFYQYPIAPFNITVKKTSKSHFSGFPRFLLSTQTLWCQVVWG
jgi:ABC-type antimicrobial peptide transport system permease subunit